MSSDLSSRAKQTFQTVSLLATVMVIGIHYKTDIPDSAVASNESWNELLQEFCFGTVARVAVPLFSLLAGLFYFRSDNGTWQTYRKKWLQRCRTVAFPYFIVASLSMMVWLIFQRLKSEPTNLSLTDFLATWLLHPPAEQLWFLRDLMLLVTIAPVVRWTTGTHRRSIVTIVCLGLTWLFNFQPFPIVAGWYLIQIETLLFFTLGCVAARQINFINRLTEVTTAQCLGFAAVWLGLAAVRVGMRADFDLWYTHDYSLLDLIIHQLSILYGCLALIGISSRLQSPWLTVLSGGSFFAFLIHEFPLRAVVEKAVTQVMDPSLSCWIVFPSVVIGCYGTAIAISRGFPTAFGLLTGGRTPSRAANVTRTAKQKLNGVPS